MLALRSRYRPTLKGSVADAADVVEHGLSQRRSTAAGNVTMRLYRLLSAPMILCVLLPLPILAQGASKRVIGTYETAGDYWQRLKITAAKRVNEYRGTFDVATQGCQGDVVMTGKATGALAIWFSKKEEFLAGGMCTIEVRFSPDFGTATVTHEYGGYSGAGCDFNGTLERVGK